MANWNVDPSYSKVRFTVKHLRTTTAIVEFTEFMAALPSEAPDSNHVIPTFSALAKTLG